MKPQQLKQIENHIRHKITMEVVDMLTESFRYVLHDKWGFAEIRTNRLTEQVNELFEDINNGLVSLEDIKRANREIGRNRE